LRVEPIEAIRTGHLAARSGRMTDWTNRIRLPGSSLTQMPVRNVLRTPRRTVLTAVGVGAAITALVAVLGMLDSFSRTVDQGGDEVMKSDPERVVVGLDTFYPTASSVVGAVGSVPEIGRVDPAVRLPAVAVTADADDEFELLVELFDFDRAAWTPTLTEDAGSEVGGLVIARKAARDLGVGPGDTITIRHPLRRADGDYTLVESPVEVGGIHPNPLRTLAYGDVSLAARIGLDGLTNTLHAYPVEGADRLDIQQAVFTLDGVTSTQAVARVSELFDEALEQFVGFLFITATAVLLLALLIAFNASRITIDERRREHATMRAFGLPVRSVMSVVTKESVLVGLVATLIGVVAGTIFLDWMLRSLATRSLPDFGIELYLSPRTLVIAAVVGAAAVALAPIFLVRRVSRMNLPDTLRVME